MNDQLAKITILEIAMWDPLRLIVRLNRPLRDGLARILPTSVSPIVIYFPLDREESQCLFRTQEFQMAPLSGWGVQLLPISRLLSPSTGPGTPVSKMAGPLSMPESRPLGLHCLHSAHPWMAQHWAPPLPLVLRSIAWSGFYWGLVAVSTTLSSLFEPD